MNSAPFQPYRESYNLGIGFCHFSVNRNCIQAICNQWSTENIGVRRESCAKNERKHGGKKLHCGKVWLVVQWVLSGSEDMNVVWIGS